MANERTTGLVGFLAGLAAGAVLGVRFAPRSGKETRDAIRGAGSKARDRFDETMDEARRSWSEAKGRAGDAATLTRDEVDDLIRFLFDEGRDLADRLRRDVAHSANEAAERTRRTADHIRHDH